MELRIIIRIRFIIHIIYMFEKFFIYDANLNDKIIGEGCIFSNGMVIARHYCNNMMPSEEYWTLSELLDEFETNPPSGRTNRKTDEWMSFPSRWEGSKRYIDQKIIDEWN